MQKEESNLLEKMLGQKIGDLTLERWYQVNGQDVEGGRFVVKGYYRDKDLAEYKSKNVGRTIPGGSLSAVYVLATENGRIAHIIQPITVELANEVEERIAAVKAVKAKMPSEQRKLLGITD